MPLRGINYRSTKPIPPIGATYPAGHHPGFAVHRCQETTPAIFAAPFSLNRKARATLGEVPEWSIGSVSKTEVPARVPGVRIPPSPPICPRSGGRNGKGRGQARLASGLCHSYGTREAGRRSKPPPPGKPASGNPSLSADLPAKRAMPQAAIPAAAVCRVPVRSWPPAFSTLITEHFKHNFRMCWGI